LKPSFADGGHESFEGLGFDVELLVIVKEISDLLLSQLADVLNGAQDRWYLAQPEHFQKFFKIVLNQESLHIGVIFGAQPLAHKLFVFVIVLVVVARVVEGANLVEVVAGQQQLVRKLRVAPNGTIIPLAAHISAVATPMHVALLNLL
jgi:hypothetical protein